MSQVHRLGVRGRRRARTDRAGAGIRGCRLEQRRRVLAVPLVGLLLHFSRERKRRIDHALELSDAYRGTAFLLGRRRRGRRRLHRQPQPPRGRPRARRVRPPRPRCLPHRRDSEFVALLHDVGKIRIPAEIIQKPGPLDAEERTVIETHTIVGQELLERVGGLLGHIGRVVRSCHEHWDGAGYPDGLAGDEIPLIARIVCACDAFSAMTTDRSYRKARVEQRGARRARALRRARSSTRTSSRRSSRFPS